MFKNLLFIFIFCLPLTSQANLKEYQKIQRDTLLLYSQYVSDTKPDIDSFSNSKEKNEWLNKQKKIVSKYVKDNEIIEDLLLTVHYESSRANLNPALILSMIETESNFKKYSISSVGAKGYMQIMPFWIDNIGFSIHNIFHLRTNIRYGCVILKHYLEIEKGNLTNALQRYNGSLGKSKYSDKVLNNMNKYL